MNIHTISLNDDVDALALRYVLEYWNCTVAIHFIATADQLVRALNGEMALFKHIILMCHGAEQGLAPPELAPQIAEQQPYQNVVSATGLSEFLHLPACLILNTGCLTGEPEFAAAFLLRVSRQKSFIGNRASKSDNSRCRNADVRNVSSSGLISSCAGCQ